MDVREIIHMEEGETEGVEVPKAPKATEAAEEVAKEVANVAEMMQVWGAYEQCLLIEYIGKLQHANAQMKKYRFKVGEEAEGVRRITTMRRRLVGHAGKAGGLLRRRGDILKMEVHEVVSEIQNTLDLAVKYGMAGMAGMAGTE